MQKGLQFTNHNYPMHFLILIDQILKIARRTSDPGSFKSVNTGYIFMQL